MKSSDNQTNTEIVKVISQGRDRTNILKNWEQKSIAFFVKWMPKWISSDMLTGIGFMGNTLVFVSFVLATYFGSLYLLIGVAGFAISWFGNSRDERMTYNLQIPRE